MMSSRETGFTLAELLIALAILGVIATFTIPKVLQSQQDDQYNAIAKEAFATVSESFQKYVLSGSLTSTTRGTDLTQYMNYARVVSSGTIDDRPNSSGTLNCNGTSSPCLKLHNGAILQPYSGESFAGTSTTNYLSFTLDPDGTTTGKADSLRILLYYNGRATSRNHAAAGSFSSGGGPLAPVSNGDPGWFSW